MLENSITGRMKHSTFGTMGRKEGEDTLIVVKLRDFSGSWHGCRSG